MRGMSDLRTRRGPRPTPVAATLTIDRLAAGGDGVGRVGAKVAFVPRTAPGDEVEVQVVEERRTWCRARVVRLLQAGPDRAEPRCRLFGTCGGCAWQHLGYAAQLAAKRAIVEDALRRIGRLEPPAVQPPLASPLAYGYRHRARLHAASNGGATVFGFYRPGSHDLIPTEHCPVLHPALNVMLAGLARVGRLLPQAAARWRAVRLDTDWDGASVRLLVLGTSGRAQMSAAAARDLQDTASANGVRLLLDASAGEPLALGPGASALWTTGESFTQVNLRQNQALVDLAIALAAPAPGEEVLDLCCGLGNLALPAAARGCRMTGVDLDAGAIAQARDNTRRLGLPATFIAEDAAAAVRELAGAGRRFPLVLLNPPRTGAREAVAVIPALSPERIVVVSCDPATLARDAAALAASGYSLRTVRPIDLFPQTAHVETIALFGRNG